MKLQYSQKTENKLKVCPESMYIPQKVSAVTKKYSKLKVLIKTSFCRNVCLPLTLKHFILKDVAVMKLDIIMCTYVGTEIAAFEPFSCL